MNQYRFEFESRLPPAELLRRFVNLAAARLNPGAPDPFDASNAPFYVRERRGGIVVFAGRPVHHIARYAYHGTVSASAAGGSEVRFRRERVIRMAAVSIQWKIGISFQVALFVWFFWNTRVPLGDALLGLGLLVLFLFGVAFVGTAAFEDGRASAEVEAESLEAALRAVASECSPVSSGAT